jgi:hypothetical protein
MPPTLDPAKRRVERASQRRTEMIRKLPAALIAIVAMLLLTASSAFAFECYNANRSPQGNAAAAKSPALVSASEALSLFCGLSEDEAADVIAQLDAQGFKTDFLINGNALMAGGLERNGNGEELLHDGQGIDHLSDEFFGALLTLAPSCGDE